MPFSDVQVPSNGQPITLRNGRLEVPDRPIIPFIEGDGTGPDIWRASQRVFDAAVELAYRGSRKIAWMEVFAGEKAFKKFDTWLPDDTVEAFRTFLVGIKGPLTTPVGGGIRSLNVALRQLLDLYVCLRPVRYFQGVPSPVKHPEKVNMVIFRENTEDVYAGIEYSAGSAESAKILEFFAREFPKEFKKIRFGTTQAIADWRNTRGVTAPTPPEVAVGVGLKPISRQGSERLIRDAINYAVAHGRRSVTFMHKGNIMKFTEGAFRDWGYAMAKREYGAVEIDKGPWCVIKAGTSVPAAGGTRKTLDHDIVLKDVIADIVFQQVITRPEEFDVIACPNLNGDYLSDALAAQVGGIGIAPGGNINYVTGHAVFEATHGTAPKYANLDKVNPGSVILSGVMMLEHLGWGEAADLIISGLESAIGAKTVTYDFARLMGDGAQEVSTSEFANRIIRAMNC